MRPPPAWSMRLPANDAVFTAPTEGLGFSEATLANLIAAGIVKAPLELEKTYKGVRLTASIQPSGAVSFNGEDCMTLSAAGGVARKSVLATPPNEPPPATNGWTFWQFRDPKSGTLRDMDSLRQEFLTSKK